MDVERELATLAEPWVRCNTGGLVIPYAMAWERRSVAQGTWSSNMRQNLSDEQLRTLRETLIRIRAQISVLDGRIIINGKSPVVGAKTSSS